MSRLNTAAAMARLSTHEGAPAKNINPEQQLRRSVLSCLLWEDSFYEEGQIIADRVVAAAQNVPAAKLAALAIEARTKYNLRHVPLMLLSVLCRIGAGSSLVSDAFPRVINRADELTEFVAIHAKLNGVTPDKVKKTLSAQAKRGLAKAFRKFDGYQLAKYNRNGAVKLRDVLFLAHPRPVSLAQEETWAKLAARTLESPDTWEVELSAGKDKKATFERLLREQKLGYLALLRNLRNMTGAGVDTALIEQALADRKGAERVLPFRYIAAARVVPQWEPSLDAAMQQSIDALPRLTGKTVVLVDVSGSMDDKLSSKSDMTRMDAAAALASIVRSDSLRVFTFSSDLVEVPPRRGMAGVDAVKRSQIHGGTELGEAVKKLNDDLVYDRLIVITDEQSSDAVPDPLESAKGYMINVASYQNGVGYHRWTHIDGFSENVIRFIHESEDQ
jgi:60 kDa SS-A/Ro ribonucleoprotein